MADSDSLARLLLRWERIAPGWNDRQSRKLQTEVLTPLTEQLPLLSQQEEEIKNFISRMEREMEEIEKDSI